MVFAGDDGDSVSYGNNGDRGANVIRDWFQGRNHIKREYTPSVTLLSKEFLKAA